MEDNSFDTQSVSLTEDEKIQYEESHKCKVVNNPKVDVKRLICAGLDVHKKKIAACISITDPQTLLPHYKLLETNTGCDEMHKLAAWLLTNGVSDVCMESTGKYWIPIYNTLESAGLNCILTHPKYVKSPKGAKNDKADSIRIANMFRMDYVVPSFVPPEDIRDMRELVRYVIKLSCNRTAEKNRLQNCFQICNIRVDTVFKDPFGKTPTSIMEYLLQGGIDNIDKDEVAKLIHPNCKTSLDEIINNIKGGKFIGSQYDLIQMHYHHIEEIDYLTKNIMDYSLDVYKKKYEKEIALLRTIPGVDLKSAIFILAEIGADMSVWDNSDSFCSWCGVVPASNSSANKVKSTHVGKGGYYLKPTLIQCVNAAIKSKTEVYFKYKYMGIKSRRGHKKAVIAIAHKMCVAIYHMLKNGVPFQPSDYKIVMEYYNKQEKSVRKHVVETLTDEEEASYLRSKGFSESEIQEILSKKPEEKPAQNQDGNNQNPEENIGGTSQKSNANPCEAEDEDNKAAKKSSKKTTKQTASSKAKESTNKSKKAETNNKTTKKSSGKKSSNSSSANSATAKGTDSGETKEANQSEKIHLRKIPEIVKKATEQKASPV